MKLSLNEINGSYSEVQFERFAQIESSINVKFSIYIYKGTGYQLGRISGFSTKTEIMDILQLTDTELDIRPDDMEYYIRSDI